MQARFPNVIIFIDFLRVISDVNGCHSSKIELKFYIYQQMFIFMDDKKGEEEIIWNLDMSSINLPNFFQDRRNQPGLEGNRHQPPDFVSKQNHFR